MVCIHCGEETHIINSRLQKRSNQVWRRRRCLSCDAVFTTEETADYGIEWLVSGPATVLEPFSRDKLLLSLYKACEHRQTALKDAGGLTDTVIQKLLPRVEAGVLKRLTIIETVQVALNRFDKAASSYYAARYR